MRSATPLCAILIRICGTIFAQTSTPGGTTSSSPNYSDSQATFRVTTRMVLVDAVVTGKKGDFIRKLASSDFEILEDGKAQRITAFAEHAESKATQREDVTPLPPHHFTNFSAPAPDHPITIILLDMLNTVILERDYARQQMLKFLASMPPGQPIALFVMSKDLKMLQGFTQSSDALINAAKSLRDKNEHVHLNTTEGEVEQAEEIDHELAAMAGRSPASAVSLAQALQSEQDFQVDVRVRATLRALQALSQAVAGYAGRKNLIWLSGEFPIGFGPESERNSRLPNYLLYQDEIHQTSGLLSSSQIAVYPIDVRGLEIGGGFSSSRGDGQSEIQRGREVNSRWSTEFTMDEIARDTGGEAFYNQNNLSKLMQRSLDEGTNYYTLAYSPQNSNWNGKYRTIEVKVKVGGAKIRHRNGYYGLPSPTSDRTTAGHLLAAAMQPTVPEGTGIMMMVKVLPPEGERKTASIDFALSPDDLVFEEGSDHHKNTKLDFMAVAVDKNLQEAGVVADTVDATLRAEAFQQVLKTGFPAHLELELKPGKYVLRLGTIDRNSERIGTVDVPLDVPIETAKK